MSLGTSTGHRPRTTTVVSPAKKPDVTEYRVRCPDCDFSKRFDSYGAAISHQRRLPCPHCDRMVGISVVPPQSPDDSLAASEAVAAAETCRRELLRDGRAPPTVKILKAMGRGPEGYPLADGPYDLTAREAARQLLDDEVVV